MIQKVVGFVNMTHCKKAGKLGCLPL